MHNKSIAVGEFIREAYNTNITKLRFVETIVID